MERIDSFYQKCDGSYYVFIGTGISLISKLIAVLLFLQIDPTFNIFSNYISDLGDGPNNSDIVYNIGVMLSGIFYCFFFLYLMRYLQKRGGNLKLTIVSFFAGFIASIGAILVGIFTADNAPQLHRLAANFSFFGNFFALIFFGLSEYYITDIPKKLSILGFIFAPLSFLFLSFYFLLSINPNFSRELTVFIEWIAFFANTTWLIAQGIYTLKSKEKL
jgi:hypothetical membrane protein